jgi:AbrB family looped-hinge helix DNA binding protein
MRTSIDNAGRVVIPAATRAKVELQPGAEFDVIVEEGSTRLVRAVPRSTLVRVGKRLVARPTADSRSPPRVDVAALIQEERNRWRRGHPRSSIQASSSLARHGIRVLGAEELARSTRLAR